MGQDSYAVQRIDYDSIVRGMEAAGMDEFIQVLSRSLAKLPEAVWCNEIKYLWVSLFNSAIRLHADKVWVWLNCQENIRHLSPAPESIHLIDVQEAELPLIGGPDDRPIAEMVPKKEWSGEPTEENFREQAEALNREILAQPHPPGCPIGCLTDWVESFRDSGTGQINASITLHEQGYRALASDLGIAWLLANYQAVTA